MNTFDRLKEWYKLIWGLIVIFGLIGVITNHMMGTVVLVIAAVCWTITRIISESFVAFQNVSNSKKTLIVEKERR